MANLQCYIEGDNPSDNPETTVNDIDESKELEDVNLIVSLVKTRVKTSLASYTGYVMNGVMT